MRRVSSAYWTTNNVEDLFGILKHGMKGIYHHCGEQHFQRYLNEFALRYNSHIKLRMDDVELANIALRGTAGKCLPYWRDSAA